MDCSVARGHRSHALSFSKEWRTSKTWLEATNFVQHGLPLKRMEDSFQWLEVTACFPQISLSKEWRKHVIAVHAGEIEGNRVVDGGRSERKSALERWATVRRGT